MGLQKILKDQLARLSAEVKLGQSQSTISATRWALFFKFSHTLNLGKGFHVAEQGFLRKEQSLGGKGRAIKIVLFFLIPRFNFLFRFCPDGVELFVENE